MTNISRRTTHCYVWISRSVILLLVVTIYAILVNRSSNTAKKMRDVIDAAKDYIKKVAHRRSILQSRNVGYSCKEIRNRVLPTVPMNSLKYGVAHARIVYKDYEFIEEELRSNYHNQCHFCYALDCKSSLNFKNKMRQLSFCLQNVYVVSEEFDVNNWGKSMNKAHFECLKLLIKKRNWNYVLLLQNHDVIIKSIYEIAEIYSLLGGVNDVEIVRAPLHFRLWDKKWDAKSLNLFRGDSNDKENATLRIAKGVVQASLSRAAVDWMVNEVNLTTLIEKINRDPYSDELLIQSLQVSDELDMPGRFTYQCYHEGSPGCITRLTYWNMRNPGNCLTCYVRHNICILGVEHISEISRSPYILVNKMLPNFDYGAIECVHELVFNRTFRNQVDAPLNRSHYLNLAHVIYHKSRGNSDWLASLNCRNLVRPYPRNQSNNFRERHNL